MRLAPPAETQPKLDARLRRRKITANEHDAGTNSPRTAQRQESKFLSLFYETIGEVFGNLPLEATQTVAEGTPVASNFWDPRDRVFVLGE